MLIVVFTRVIIISYGSMVFGFVVAASDIFNGWSIRPFVDGVGFGDWVSFYVGWSVGSAVGDVGVVVGGVRIAILTQYSISVIVNDTS